MQISLMVARLIHFFSFMELWQSKLQSNSNEKFSFNFCVFRLRAFFANKEFKRQRPRWWAHAICVASIEAQQAAETTVGYIHFSFCLANL